ncbi:Afadin and alpha-actinin-binding-domain-containing protein [Terfezia claveryi]|nr:Afadin and alpha-actinin-binding-domain-containing protein [Terfezia claveryi]
MDLSSASTYLNNLLAKAGLLKGGTAVNFHNPSSDDGSTTRIINLVHDLVTRREKEEEQLESLANTIRTLRSDNAKLQQANEKLGKKCEELERKNVTLEGQQNAFNSTLRTSEAAAKSLRDETTRLKMVLQQVRNQFAIDIRKRDVQLGKIKEQLLNPRRNPKNVNTITITGTVPPAAADVAPQSACGPDCMAQDTADALTELSQTLANENDNLVSITRQTLSTLNTIQGIQDDCHFPPEEESGDAYLSVCPQSFEALSEELQRSLESLREMINQPNYVAIEELQERDKIIEEKEKEIARLQARIEVVEEEWRKAIEMVKMWNQSMRGKLPSTAVAPIEATQERTVGGLEQILEEDEEEEEEEIRVQVQKKQVYSAAEQHVEERERCEDPGNSGDIFLDEEQLQREASMIVDEVGDDAEAEEDEEQNQERMKYMLEDMDGEYDVVNREQFEEIQGEEDSERMGHDGAEGSEALEEPDDEHQLEDEIADLPDQEHPGGALKASINTAALNSTPPPTSPPNSPPHRPRRTPRTIKTRNLDENVSPSPLKLKSTPSKRIPNPRRSPRKALAPASPSPIHTKINRFLSDILQAPATPTESSKKATPKKTTKRAHFESPLIQDTPELGTPKRRNKGPTPPQFGKFKDENTPTTPRRTSRVFNRKLELDTSGKGQENTLDTPRRTSGKSNKRLELDTLRKGQENTLDTPRRSSRASKKRVLLDTPEQGEDETAGTPRRTSRVPKKRVLFDTPEQPASTRVSKRRKTPAIKKHGGAMRLDNKDDEAFAH